MASRNSKSIPLQQALDFLLESDDNDLDSSTGGMSSGEEEELDELLTGGGELDFQTE